MKPLPMACLLFSTAFFPAATAEASSLTTRGSVEQVQVTGAKAGTRLSLVNREGAVVDSQKAGPLGGAVFRNVKPGPGYRVRHRGDRSRAFAVLSDRSGIDVPTELPPCPGLRGEACRDYEPFVNGG